MKHFLLAVLLTTGCTGGDVAGPIDGTGGEDAVAGRMGGSGGTGGTGLVILPGTGAAASGAGGMEATGGVVQGAGGVMPDAGGQDSLVMADILPGEWKMWIDTERYYCGTFQDAVSDVTPRDVLITDDLKLFVISHDQQQVLWWSAGVVSNNVWEPDVSTWGSATYVELRAEDPDRLVGTGENDPAPCAPGVSGLTTTYVFELTR